MCEKCPLCDRQVDKKTRAFVLMVISSKENMLKYQSGVLTLENWL